MWAVSGKCFNCTTLDGIHWTEAPRSAQLRGVSIDTLWTDDEALKKENVICPFVVHRDGKRIMTFKNA